MSAVSGATDPAVGSVVVAAAAVAAEDTERPGGAGATVARIVTGGSVAATRQSWAAAIHQSSLTGYLGVEAWRGDVKWRED